MIKIVKAEYVDPTRLHLTFFDGAHGDYDFAPFMAQATALTLPLQDPEVFKDHFLELGALCWKNGLEFSPSALYNALQTTEKLAFTQRAA